MNSPVAPSLESKLLPDVIAWVENGDFDWNSGTRTNQDQVTEFLATTISDLAGPETYIELTRTSPASDSPSNPRIESRGIYVVTEGRTVFDSVIPDSDDQRENASLRDRFDKIYQEHASQELSVAKGSLSRSLPGL